MLVRLTDFLLRIRLTDSVSINKLFLYPMPDMFSDLNINQLYNYFNFFYKLFVILKQKMLDLNYFLCCRYKGITTCEVSRTACTVKKSRRPWHVGSSFSSMPPLLFPQWRYTSIYFFWKINVYNYISNFLN